MSGMNGMSGMSASLRVAWGSFLRFFEIVGVLIRHGLGQLVGARADRWPRLRRAFPTAGHPPPEQLRMLFEAVGGTFIKFGQMLALQPDILPVAYCDALFKLLDRVEPFGYDDVERTLREELGRGAGEIFDSLEREPLATASVGQVHVGYLGDRKVAVKIQRPNVQTEFQSDIWLMLVAMAVVRRLRIKPLYWIIDPMTEFVSWTREELDYRFEARYSEALRSQAVDLQAQYIPGVQDELTTRRTLVVEFLDGVTLLNYLRARERNDEVLLRRLEAMGFDRRRFAANIVENFLGNAFRFGLYHADLHPANLMILERSVVGYVDFGITGVLSQYARSRLMNMTLALAIGDMDLLNRDFLELTVHGPGSDLEGFRAGLDRLAAGWYVEERGERQLDASFTKIMTEMLHLSRATGVMPERDIVKYIRSSIAIDGLLTRFEPEFDLGTYLVATCSRYVKWQRRSTHFSVSRMLDFSSASGRLLRDGTPRASEMLDRLSAGELIAGVDAEGGAGHDGTALRGRAVQLALAAFGTALLMTTGSPAPAWGLNPWTAELIFVVAALAMLLVTLRRLAAQRGARR